MAQLPSGMVSFLFTDIEGSTRLFSRLGDDYREMLAEHNQRLRRVWSEFDGYEIKTEGDSFFVAFDDAAAALDAAVAAQTALSSKRWRLAEPRIRVGVHSGLAAPTEDDYVSLAVHQAARVVGAAHGGQSLASEATVKLAKDDTSVAVRPLGHYRLRGFDDPVLLFHASAHGSTAEFPPVRAMPADGNNIVQPLTTFIGRDRDMAGIAELLDEGRLVTILGPGGVGKTRLANELGRELTPLFEGGVWIADLASVEPTAPVGGLVAGSVGAQPGGRDPLVALADYLGSELVLLILDTCEHVRDSVREVVDTVMRRLPNLTILTTSRVPLGVDYERVWHLQPLPVGAPEEGAEQLFIERLGSGPVDAAEVVAIGELSRRLDGIPLAIELAAARARVSSPRAVLATLDDHARLLRLKQSGTDPRQESLGAVVEWSFGLLSPTEQRVFLRLGTFAASFSEATGSAAAADDAIDRLDVAETIWSLADHSLLVRVDAANETRYGMLETVRAYALEHLADAERLKTAKQLAGGLLDRVGPWLPVSGAWVDEMRVEVDNLRGLIPTLREAEPETAQLLALSILFYLTVESDYSTAVEEADRYASDLAAETVERSILLARTAQQHHRVGDFDTTALLDEAQRLVDELGPEPAWASGSVGSSRTEMLAATGRVEAAITIAAEALRGDLSDRERELWLHELGLMTMDDVPAAGVDYFERALALTPVENLVASAMTHGNLAEALMRIGEHERAAEYQLNALLLAEQLGMPLLVGFALMVAARLQAAAAAWAEAVRLHGAADRIIEEAGYMLDPRDVALSEQMLEDAKSRVGDTYQPALDAGYALTIDEATRAGIQALQSVAAPTAR